MVSPGPAVLLLACFVTSKFGDVAMQTVAVEVGPLLSRAAWFVTGYPPGRTTSQPRPGVPLKVVGMVAVNVNFCVSPGLRELVVHTLAAVQLPPPGTVGLTKTGVTPLLAVSVNPVEPGAV